MNHKDPNDEGNSPKYYTGKHCIEKDCQKPAGTAWGPHWCFEHNCERMARIRTALEEAVNSF